MVWVESLSYTLFHNVPSFPFIHGKNKIGDTNEKYYVYYGCDGYRDWSCGWVSGVWDRIHSNVCVEDPSKATPGFNDRQCSDASFLSADVLAVITGMYGEREISCVLRVQNNV